ncbi:MAG: hypothetical protein AAGA29_11550 [Planctomycetota bacterium]
MGKQRTKSELLFEELCKLENIPFDRLLELQDDKQPDYEIAPKGEKVVVEIKQIEPNDEDKAFAAALEQDGMATQCRSPDRMSRRIRNHMRDSCQQFTSYLSRNSPVPAMLVVFDNAKNHYTDPYTIQVALHGYEQVTLGVGPPGVDPVVIDAGFGERNNRELRPDKNEHLSAVATLHECWEVYKPHDRFLRMAIYHNPYAETPLSPKLWSSPRVKNFALTDKVKKCVQTWRCLEEDGPSA